jgi:selenide,water dikinase
MDKVHEAGGVLIGGHSVDDTELKYGLAVTGTVHPNRLVTVDGAKPGDTLILTKPLGTGIISTAAKAGMVPDELVALISRSMATLNRTASELMQQVGVDACTDITGFGLLGHAAQMAERSRVGLRFHLDSIPLFPQVTDFAQRGLCPGGLFRNKDYYRERVDFADGIPEHVQDILFDAQTSGGLLICLKPASADTLLIRLRESGPAEAAIVGEVVEGVSGRIRVD